MGGPWEQYQAPSDGPWAQYAATDAPASPSGYGANVKAGLTEGATGLGQMLLDRITNPASIATDLAEKVPGAVEAAMRVFGHVPTPAELEALHGQAATIHNLSHPMGDLAPKVTQATGYDPSQTTADTVGERAVRATARAAPGLALPAGEGYSLRGLIQQVPSIIGSGLGETAAEEAVPDELKPIAAQAGALVGGVAPHAAVVGGRAALAAVPEGLKTTAGQIAAGASPEAAETQAARLLASRATDPQAAAAALAENGELVAGSQPTTFQQSGDVGLGGLEREQATKNPELFNQRRAEQGVARTEAVSGIQQGADPNDVAKTLKAQFEDLDTRTQADVDRATATAQAKVSALGGAATPEAYGAAIRSAEQEAADASHARESALWKAVDPNGDLTGNVTQTVQDAARIRDEVPRTAKPMEGEEAAIFQAASEMQPLSPVSDLIALRSRVNDAMRAERGPGGNAQAYRRLVQLRGTIQDNLATTIAHQVALDDSAVARGALESQDTLSARLQAWIDEHQPTAARGDAGAADRAASRGSPATLFGDRGAASVEAAGSRNPARGEGVPPAAELTAAEADVNAHRDADTKSIFSAIRKLGGLKLRGADGEQVPGPDVAPLLAESRQPGLVNNASGMTPEEMGQALADRGWFGPNPGDPAEAFTAAVDRQARGSRVYHPEGLSDTERADLGRVERELQEAGVKPGDSREVAARKLAQYRRSGSTYQDITSSAGIEGAEQMSPKALLEEIQLREALERHEAGVDEHGAEFDRHFNSQPAPTFDEEAKGRLDLATAATKEGKQTHGVEPIRSMMRDTGTKGQFVLPDGKVPEKFFHPGAKAFSDIQALIKAAGAKVIPTLVDYAAMSLRRAAEMADGTLDPTKFSRWRQAHADALRALPADVQAKFSDASRAAGAVREAQTARTKALKEAQQGAIGKVMGLTEGQDVTKTIGAILNGRTAVADMKALAKATAGNPEARAGLRQAVADHITSKLIGNTEAGTTGTPQLKADQFQTFMKTATPALNLIFKPDEVALMKAVAADLQRANRSVNTKLPGQSNTAQDLEALKRSPLARHSKTLLTTLAGGLGLAAHGATGGFAGVFGLLVAEHLHSVGVERIDQLVTEAMLHPAVARRLLAKVPEGPKKGAALEALGRGIVRSLAVSTAASSNQPNPLK